MTCADKQVRCVITSPTGEMFIGTNACNSPQTLCPRAPGEDYAKCKDVCHQEGHAEIIALRAAGKHAQGSTARVSGIDWICRNCQIALVKAGVLTFSIVR